MGEARDILMNNTLLRNSVARAVEVTAENLADIAMQAGGVVLNAAAWAGEPERPFGVRIPTLHGNLDAEIGDYVVRSHHTGRYEVMSAEHYKQAYLDVSPPEIVEAIQNAPEPAPEFETEEDLQAHTHRNLFEERRKNMYGRSADSD